MLKPGGFPAILASRTKFLLNRPKPLRHKSLAVAPDKDAVSQEEVDVFARIAWILSLDRWALDLPSPTRLRELCLG